MSRSAPKKRVAPKKSGVEIEAAALEEQAVLLQQAAARLRGAPKEKSKDPVGPESDPSHGEDAEGDQEEIADDVAESLEWVGDEWKAPFRAFLDRNVAADSGTLFFQLYDVHNYNHAAEILIYAYPSLFTELAKALLEFRIRTEWVIKGGGNESPVPQELQGKLYPAGWHETRLKGHMLFESHISRKTPRSDKQGNQRLKKSGFPMYEAEASIEPILRRSVVDAHKIDHVKGRIAFDMEWNSKDQTFDRDLYAMRLFHEAHLISAGVLLTRSSDLAPVFKGLDQVIPKSDGKKFSSKYGASTTWMGKLLYRLRSSRSGGCPVLALGMRRLCIGDWDEYAKEHSIRV